MFDKKIKIKVNAEEYKLIRDALLNFRNERIRQGMSADFVNELMYKIMK